jgi:hypothetical protein
MFGGGVVGNVLGSVLGNVPGGIPDKGIGSLRFSGLINLVGVVFARREHTMTFQAAALRNTQNAVNCRTSEWATT